MEQSEYVQPDRAVAVMYAACAACRFMGEVVTVDEDVNTVFVQARSHAQAAHIGESMTGIEIVWDVIPAI
ncbi:hypothetical protein [Streptomyces sp. CdTB01]|uniref:hypothetical protein n=1 Tax=Streptomyces sp. CdTB01 TaxID=1725411 RepID=UPI00073A8ABA|nr:hypothetical protein [Streptomyces sp. CdTB01]ALV38107.1 hypothetical protein AS200_43290 [Streptomyces sp. CdTB01]